MLHRGSVVTVRIIGRASCLPPFKMPESPVPQLQTRVSESSVFRRDYTHRMPHAIG